MYTNAKLFLTVVIYTHIYTHIHIVLNINRLIHRYTTILMSVCIYIQANAYLQIDEKNLNNYNLNFIYYYYSYYIESIK